MLARLLITVGLVATGLLFILLTTTTPASAGAIGIFVVFLLGYVVTLCAVTFTLWALVALASKVGRNTRLWRKGRRISLRKSYYYSSVISLGPTIIISLQSVGGVGFYDLGLVAIFIFLGCVYVSRRAA